MIHTVTAQELHQWLANDEAVLVDVREPAEYQAGHIAGSTLIPLGTVNVAKLPELNGRKLVMQCHLGGRSRTACMKLLSENPELEPYNLEGGITAWALAGFEVKR
jgi:rhodanese-related sulfurtransferase